MITVTKKRDKNPESVDKQLVTTQVADLATRFPLYNFYQIHIVRNVRYFI